MVAVSNNYDCAEETIPDVFQAPMEGSRKWKGRSHRTVNGKAHHNGVIWPVFQSSYGKNKHPWHKPVKSASGTNPALRGIMHLNNITFANFGQNCAGYDIVFRTNFDEDDVNWPINATDIKYLSVPEVNKIYLDEPPAGKINPAMQNNFIRFSIEIKLKKGFQR